MGRRAALMGSWRHRWGESSDGEQGVPMGRWRRRWGEASGGEMAASVGRWRRRWGEGADGEQGAPMGSTAAPMGTKGRASGELVAATVVASNGSSAQGRRSGANGEGAG
ncbi:hypothetical protein GUJ93_ZPchr0010g9137 [Zizania palustris]|uniref:Uncharacterized protein n=1 Tax=Zizania palustris TaxID=103762 RepID=A0A8J5TE10_ZIZPA|nr:hypothetical protein GUJ93_ZPchr0010g9137 [Zizania palustris]